MSLLYFRRRKIGAIVFNNRHMEIFSVYKNQLVQFLAQEKRNQYQIYLSKRVYKHYTTFRMIFVNKNFY